MARTYYEADADLSLLACRRVGVLGYGNQGRAHALNLRDSGCDIRVGARAEGHSRQHANGDGFTVDSIELVSQWADVIALLLPDQFHKPVFDAAIAPHLRSGDVLLLAHGFSLQFGQLDPAPEVDVALVAPVGPGEMLRRLYLAGSGIPALVAVHQNMSGGALDLGLSYAAALGCGRVGILETTVKEETESDLFGEQAVLCGGLTELMKAGFRTLVEAGYQPELAYFECVHQIKLIVDLVYERGLAGMREAISDTAEFGDYVSGPRVVDQHVQASMKGVLSEIQDGTFADKWIAEFEAGMPWLTLRRSAERDDPIEDVGRRLRAMMPSEPPEG